MSTYDNLFFIFATKQLSYHTYRSTSLHQQTDQANPPYPALRPYHTAKIQNNQEKQELG